jgi:outer membrane protein assembly factor BamB
MTFLVRHRCLARSRYLGLLLPAIVAVSPALLAAADWPAYRHDNRRSGVTGESLAAESLAAVWTYRSPQPPQPAWAGPAKWDAYAGIRPLRSMRNYDPVFHVIAAGDSVYFGSSADDSLHCLDAATGSEKWRFTTDAPVRVAPSLFGDVLYFGSDDGFAYAVRANDGTLIWKYAPTPDRRRILNNGRFISHWPVRTGVLVADGTAYFAASLLPWRETYLCAVDARTGKPTGTGHYCRALGGSLTMEGPPLASATELIIPQGRVAPLLVRRADGQPVGSLDGGGGCFTLLTNDAEILHGPGNKTGWITQSSAKTRAKVATFGGGNAMIVAGDTAIVLGDRQLTAIDRKTREELWKADCDCPFTLVKAGQHVFVGGVDQVAAFAVKTGRQVWRAPVHGRAYGLAVANGALLVSTDEGEIVCFRSAGARAASPPPRNVAAEDLDGTNSLKSATLWGGAEPANRLNSTSVALPTEQGLPEKENGPVGHWRFERASIQSRGGQPLRGDAVTGGEVRDLAGGANATIIGQARLTRVGGVEALALDGSTVSAVIGGDLAKLPLPKKALTAEAWVRVDAPQRWGGIVGAIQDNGNDEQGWLLGLNDSRFSLALRGTEGSDRLTYLTADHDFVTGQWYHVVGTYDGAEMKLYVNGVPAATSTAEKGPIDYPPAAFYEIGAYHDRDEYNRLQGMLREVRVYSRALGPEEIARHYRADEDDFGGAMAFAVAPYLQFRRPGVAEVRWQTDAASASIVHVRLAGDPRRYADSTPTTDHRVTIEVPKRNRVYQYQIEGVIDGRRCYSAEFQCDTFFNYTLPSFADVDAELPASADTAVEGLARNQRFEPSPKPLPQPLPTTLPDADHLSVDTPVPATLRGGGLAVVRQRGDSPSRAPDRDQAMADAARQILAATGLERGICLVVGCGDGQLAWQLVRQSQLKVIGVDTDPDHVAAARRRLAATGGYGTRVTIHHVESLADLPWQGQCANLVVAQRTLTEGKPVGDAAEIARLLRPDGGVALVGQPPRSTPSLTRKSLATWLNAASLKYVIQDDEKGLWARVVRGPLSGGGQWSHQYGRADNSAFGGESLGGARRADELSVQWIGRPGPRAQADRNGRKPAPLAIAGRLFVQGLHRLIALDAHNGTILWTLEIPRLERFNIPRDSSNWCADEETLFVAVEEHCWQIDAATGNVAERHRVAAGPRKEWHYDWGYLARTGPLLIGTAVKRGAAYVNFWGGSSAGWYDAPSGVATYKVCSETLFAVDVAQVADRDQAQAATATSGHGSPVLTPPMTWTYARGVIINSTLTATPSHVYFVACRDQEVIDSSSRRIDMPQLWRDPYLVALDSRTGKTVWEQPLTTSAGISVCYMASGGGKIVLVASGEKKYHIDVFNQRDGSAAWQFQFDWPDGKHDHGKAMSRPVIVGRQLYVRPRVLDLETGKLLPRTMPGGGCGTYAATTHSILFRSGNVTLWDRDDGSTSSWSRLRPGCWLSTIPACGLILSPEAGGGCSCGSWLETSVAFSPAEDGGGKP